jgi:hypothetical protein
MVRNENRSQAGDPLSALLFSLVLDTVITNLEVRGYITTRLKQICAYADDIVILRRTTQVLTNTFLKLKQEALTAGLIININKAKYLFIPENPNHKTYLTAGDERLKQVNSFKYLGTMVNTVNSIKEEIKERFAAGNRAYHVHKKLLKSKLITQNVELQHYNTLIRPVVTYAYETWVLKEKEINKLMTFERKIMGKIYGPTRTADGYWTIKTNQEINDTLKGQNIIGFIKKKRLSWLGYIELMAEESIVQKIKRWKPMSKRPIWRPKTRCEDGVLGDIRILNVNNWKKVAQDRDRWKEVVQRARTLHRL